MRENKTVLWSECCNDPWKHSKWKYPSLAGIRQAAKAYMIVQEFEGSQLTVIGLTLSMPSAAAADTLVHVRL